MLVVIRKSYITFLYFFVLSKYVISPFLTFSYLFLPLKSRNIKKKYKKVKKSDDTFPDVLVSCPVLIAYYTVPFAIHVVSPICFAV